MNILVLCESYPSPGNLYTMGFVHSRVLEYAKFGHDVTVMSFSATAPYRFEGVPVVPTLTPDEARPFDVMVAHAPNWRHHLRFLRKAPPLPVVLVIHGHEVLRTGEY